MAMTQANINKGAQVYSEALWDKICFQLAMGNSLRKVCEMKGMPSLTSAWKWRTNHPYAASQYALAKMESADSDQDKIEEISEKVLTGEYDPNAARVAMDGIKWCASKKKPKVYGDLHKYINEAETLKVEHNITINTNSLLGSIGQTIDVKPDIVESKPLPPSE